MTKYFELNWKIPVAPKLQEGTVGDRWTEENQNFDFEAECKFKIDECGFFISWKSEGKVNLKEYLFIYLVVPHQSSTNFSYFATYFWIIKNCNSIATNILEKYSKKAKKNF